MVRADWSSSKINKKLGVVGISATAHTGRTVWQISKQDIWSVMYWQAWKLECALPPLYTGTNIYCLAYLNGGGCSVQLDFKTGYVERSIPTNVNSYIITDWFFFFRESLTVWLPGEVSGWSNYFSAQQDFLFSSVHEPTPTLRKIGSCKDLVCKENHEILFVPSLAICFEIPSVTFRM